MGVVTSVDMTIAQREIILSLLGRYLPEVTVWVYGLRVKRTARPSSDLDMAIFTDTTQRRAVSDFKEALEESNLPFRVDLFVWNEIPERFRKSISAQHVVLQEMERAV